MSDHLPKLECLLISTQSRYAIAATVLLVMAAAGCGSSNKEPRRAAGTDAAPKSAPRHEKTARSATKSDSDDVAQTMDRFTMEGFAPDGSKRWDLVGTEAAIDGDMVTIQRPSGVGHDPERTAYLDASVAQVNQANRRIRLEHDVTLHTTDGVWLLSPSMYWLPDQNQVLTEAPVRIETDHMLIRGRGAVADTQLKRAKVVRDVEVVLIPTDHETVEDIRHVKITCEGPLTFDYEKNIATFEKDVHIEDPQGDLYSDKLVAYLNRETRTISYAEATGAVRIVQGKQTIRGGRAVYEPATGKLTLLDAPSLSISLDDTQQSALPMGGGRRDPASGGAGGSFDARMGR